VGVISFRALPIEAYPDVANNYVHTSPVPALAEEIERQVTCHRDPNAAFPTWPFAFTTLAGLSSLMLIFDDVPPAT